MDELSDMDLALIRFGLSTEMQNNNSPELENLYDRILAECARRNEIASRE